ncbi:MAG: hypothetical protein ACFE7S_03450 [Candidatus Hodarchaeota archaeon]
MEEDIEREEKRRGLDEKSIRNIFLDLSTILVGVAIGFSVTFATELGIGGIINFLLIGVLILFFWWQYLTHRLKYIRPAMPFPIIDIFILLVISLFPCVMYSITWFQWPSYSILVVLGTLFAIWGVWWHHAIKEFSTEIAKHGEERKTRFERQLSVEVAIIYFAGTIISILYPLPISGSFIMSIVDIGTISLSLIWVGIRNKIFSRR